MHSPHSPKKRSPKKGELYPSRRSAFRAAKRLFGIPMHTKPDEVVLPNTDDGVARKLSQENKRLYIFRVFLGIFTLGQGEIHIREDHPKEYPDGGVQTSHFNAGTGGKKLRFHFYFFSKRR